MWLWGAITVVGIPLLVFVMVRLFSDRGYGAAKRQGPEAGAGPRSGARQILDERFARGELTADEYQERLRVLGEGH
ncbi:SHOCT domain-containing protein [Arthrobacter celericrescens]|uniref:SHOCT domain-containing protein n=1 Tax=Arthrobacter celericrescens TaxID=2320851 RepID=UPI00315C5580